MKKIVYKAVSLLLLVSIIFSLSGCNVLPQGNEITEKPTFKLYSQSQKQEYVKKYLSEKYEKEFEITSEIFKKQENVFVTENEFFTTARSDDGDFLCVWIDDYGNIMDDSFVQELDDEILDLFRSIIDEHLPVEFVIRVKTELWKNPTKVWTIEDDVKEFLNTEHTHTYIRIFVANSEDVTEEMLDKVVSELDFCDASLDVYQYNNLDSTPTEIDDSSLVYTRYIHKEK